ncbi:MAG: type II 3-dehydroquinate dehydratase [Bacteroidota bacterium]|nr:type II 3-dehydroquinate dehydratase [Bacteroidota bacterium]
MPNMIDPLNILVINGPNLNLLGSRETAHYGHATLDEVAADLRMACPEVALEFFQSNHEGDLVDRLQEAVKASTFGVVLNAGAYTHTSVALRDAISSVSLPVVEVHISNIYARESFRKHSFLAPVCRGQISGLGTDGYRLAVLWLQTLAEQSGA